MRPSTSFTLFRLLLVAALAVVAPATRPGAVMHAADPIAGDPAPAAGLPEAPWTAVAASGRVEAQPAGGIPDAWSPVRRGDRLAPGGRLRTGPHGRVTLTRGEDVVIVDPGAEVSLPAEGQAASAVQGRGNVLYEVHREPDVHFQVVTPYLVAGVKGTAFSVLVNEAFTSVGVSQGHVEVRATLTDERADLFTGDMALLEGPMGRLEVRRDPREGARDLAREEGQLMRRAREDAGKLARRAACDDLGDPVLYDFASDAFIYYDDLELKRLLGDFDPALYDPLRDDEWLKSGSLEGKLDDDGERLEEIEDCQDLTSSNSGTSSGSVP
jgi:hypothetical protein